MANLELEAEAKAMFFSYACHTFFMAHDSAAIYERYKAFGISEALEQAWRREFIAHWVSRLSTDDMTAVNWLRDADADEALPDLLGIAGNGDSYARLWFANAIWHIAERARLPASLSDQVARTTVNLWLSAANGPVELSEQHRQWIEGVISKGALDASTPEEF